MFPDERKKQEALPLFEQRARHDHPDTSHAWARRANKKLSKQITEALGYIENHPGYAARPLEVMVGCKMGTVWKVAKIMEDKKLITRSKSPKDPAYRLYPAPQKQPESEESNH